MASNIVIPTPMNELDFSEFASVSKDDWLEKVVKDLRGEELESLHWTMEGEHMIAPFFGVEDEPDAQRPQQTISSSWDIGFRIRVDDLTRANQIALEVLNEGVNHLRFEFDELPSRDNLAVALDQIQLELIKTTLLFPSESVDFELDSHIELASPESEITISHGPSEIELGNALLKANACIQAGQEVKFVMYTDEHFYKTICRIRALKSLWFNLSKAWSKDLKWPQIQAFVPSLARDNANHNMISASSMALSCVVGGVTSMFIAPGDSYSQPNGTSFSRRMAINIHHLLREESHLTKVHDPGAGSFFIENTTADVAAQAWTYFQNHSLS